MKDIIYSFLQSSRKYYRVMLVVIIFLVLIVSFFSGSDLDNFLHHPLALTDLDWQKKSVECIQGYLPPDDVVGVYILTEANSSEQIADLYQLQYMFVPTVLDVDNPWMHSYVLVKAASVNLLDEKMKNDWDMVVDCSGLILLTNEADLQ